MTFGLENVQRKNDIISGERAAIVERGARAYQEAIGQAVVRYLHGTRRHGVHSVRLVRRAAHEAREGELHALRGVTPEDVAVERIEGEEVLVVKPRRSLLGKQPSLRGIRVHVIKMLEVGRIFEITE